MIININYNTHKKKKNPILSQNTALYYLPFLTLVEIF